MLVEMEPARAYQQHRGGFAQRIGLAILGVGEAELAAPPVLEIGLAVDQYIPARAGGVLEIGHEHLGARIERVDDHLGIGRAGDFDAAVEEVGGDRRDLPVGLAERGGLGREVGQLARVKARLPVAARGEQVAAAAIEPVMQRLDQIKRGGGEDLVVADMSARPRVDHPRRFSSIAMW